MAEIRRVLRPGGYAILKEPIRVSRFYDRLRRLFPAQENTSDYEHPLTQDELSSVTRDFVPSQMRFFRLPFVRFVKGRSAWRVSGFLLRNFPALSHFATVVVLKLRTEAGPTTHAGSERSQVT